jgi:hypothetical protein
VSKQSGTKLVHTSGVTTINFVDGVYNQTFATLFNEIQLTFWHWSFTFNSNKSPT